MAVKPDATFWTTGTLAVIAIFMVAAIAIILWGMRTKRVRQAAEREVAADSHAVHGDAPARADTTPAIEPAPPAVKPVMRPPVAPAPPPLAGNDIPVVAAAPLDASPASLAADLATSPVPPPPAQAATQASVSTTDDLTQLKGVGPKLATRLGELGVTQYAQIAELSPDAAAALDAQLGNFRGRLERDRWIEQANYLARGDRDGFEAAFGKL